MTVRSRLPYPQIVLEALAIVDQSNDNPTRCEDCGRASVQYVVITKEAYASEGLPGNLGATLCCTDCADFFFALPGLAAKVMACVLIENGKVIF